jgi:hypothetical protein
MPTKKQFKDLANLRIKEAEALYSAGLYDGAYYLAGYAMELALKARICKILKINDYPDRQNFAKAYKIHSILDLIYLAGLDTDFRTKMTNPSTGVSTPFGNNWTTLLSRWNESKRYDSKGSISQSTARDFLDALQNTPDGFLTWLKTKW